MHFCMTILLTIMEPEACLLYRKNCENLDVDLEAIACVHSLQYSTVQFKLAIRQFFDCTLNACVSYRIIKPRPRNSHFLYVTTAFSRTRSNWTRIFAGPRRARYAIVAVVGPSSVVRPVVISGKLSKADP